MTFKTKIMKSYFVYILECSDKSYYTGITNEVERRVAEHQYGLNPKCYTYRRRPVILKFVEQFNDVNQTIAREKQIKGWTRRKKEALMIQDFDRLVELSKCYSKSDVILSLSKDGKSRKTICETAHSSTSSE